MYYCLYSPSISSSRLCITLLFMALMLFNHGAHCQFQEIQIIQKPDVQSEIFDTSGDFKFMAIHSNHNNTLYIYECMRPQFDENLVFEQKQQITLDAQIYTILKISTEHSMIYLGCFQTDTVRIYRLNASSNLFYLQKTFKLNDYKYLTAIAGHPPQPNLVALGVFGSLLLVNILSDQVQTFQQISVAQEAVQAISFSLNGQFLSASGTSLRIDIYQYNKDIQQYQELNTFPQDQQIKQLRFSSSIIYPEYPFTIIATLKTQIKIYVYNEGIGYYTEFKVIKDHHGFINDKMTILIENSIKEDINAATVFKINKQSHEYERRQELEVVMMNTARFEQTSGNLILLGTNNIRTFRYCDIDYCENCQIVFNSSTSIADINFDCVKCFTGYQPKQGVECIHCNQYPSLCHNCELPDKCNKCVDGFTVSTAHFCVACHIDNCQQCDETEVCLICEEDYNLIKDDNICDQKNNRINLVGIIVGTIVGAVIIVIVALYSLYRKSENNLRLAQQKNQSRSFRKNKSRIGKIGSNHNSRKQSLLGTRQEIKSVYEDYEGSSDSQSCKD